MAKTKGMPTVTIVIITVIVIAIAIAGVGVYLVSKDGVENGGGEGIPTSPTTITLNPIADARVQSDNANINYGDTALGVLGEHYFGLFCINSYLMFDLSDIPTNSSIIDARLELYAYYVGEITTTVGAHYCPNVSWTELGITWNNAPSFTSTPTDSAILVGYKSDIWYSWNITTDVRYALSTRKLSIVLKIEDTEDKVFGAAFYSKDTYSEYRPKLIINYS